MPQLSSLLDDDLAADLPQEPITDIAELDLATGGKGTAAAQEKFPPPAKPSQSLEDLLGEKPDDLQKTIDDPNFDEITFAAKYEDPASQDLAFKVHEARAARGFKDPEGKTYPHYSHKMTFGDVASGFGSWGRGMAMSVPRLFKQAGQAILSDPNAATTTAENVIGVQMAGQSGERLARGLLDWGEQLPLDYAQKKFAADPARIDAAVGVLPDYLKGRGEILQAGKKVPYAQIYGPMLTTALMKARAGKPLTPKESAEVNVMVAQLEPEDAKREALKNKFGQTVGATRKDIKLASGIPLDEGAVADYMKWRNEGVPVSEILGPENLKRIGAEPVDPGATAAIGAIMDPTNLMLIKTPGLPGMRRVGGALATALGGTGEVLATKGGRLVLGGAAAGGGYAAAQKIIEGDWKNAGKIGAGILAAGALAKIGGAAKVLRQQGFEALTNGTWVAPATEAAAKAARATAGAPALTKFAKTAIPNAKVRASNTVIDMLATPVGAAPLNLAMAAGDKENFWGNFAALSEGAPLFGAMGSLTGGLKPQFTKAILPSMRANGQARFTEMAQRGDKWSQASARYVQRLPEAGKNMVYELTDALGGMETTGPQGQKGVSEIVPLSAADYAAFKAERGLPAGNDRGLAMHNGKAYVNAEHPSMMGPEGKGVFGHVAGHEMGGHVAQNILRAFSGKGGPLYDGVMGKIKAQLTDKSGKPTPEFQQFIDGYNKELTKSGARPLTDAQAIDEFVAETAGRIFSTKGTADLVIPEGIRDKIQRGIGEFFGGKIGIDPREVGGRSYFNHKENAEVTGIYLDALRQIVSPAARTALNVDPSTPPPAGPTPAPTPTGGPPAPGAPPVVPPAAPPAAPARVPVPPMPTPTGVGPFGRGALAGGVPEMASQPRQGALAPENAPKASESSPSEPVTPSSEAPPAPKPAEEAQISPAPAEAPSEGVGRPTGILPARTVDDDAADSLIKAAPDGNQAALDLANQAAEGDPRLFQRRTDPLTGRVAYSGRLDFNKPEHRALVRQLGMGEGDIAKIQAADSGGDIRYVDYWSAEKAVDPDDITGKERKRDYELDKGKKSRQLMQENKGIVFTGVEVTKNGKVLQRGISLDKLVANLSKLLGAAKTHLTPEQQAKAKIYADINDPAIREDIKAYVENHKNGYKGDGSGPVEGMTQTGVPIPIERGRFDILNAALNYDISGKPAEHARKLAADEAARATGVKVRKRPALQPQTQLKAEDAQRVAKENQWAVDDQTGDVNPFRAMLNKGGKFTYTNKAGETRVGTGDILESVWENLSPDMIEDVRTAPSGEPAIVRKVGLEAPAGEFSPEGINWGNVAAGFMPGGGEAIAERPKGTLAGEEFGGPSQRALDERKAKLPPYTTSTREDTKRGWGEIKIQDDSGKDVGYIAYTHRPDGTVQVNSSHVEAFARGKGYGEALYREMAKEMQRLGKDTLTSWVTSKEAFKVRNKLFPTEFRESESDARGDVAYSDVSSKVLPDFSYMPGGGDGEAKKGALEPEVEIAKVVKKGDKHFVEVEGETEPVYQGETAADAQKVADQWNLEEADARRNMGAVHNLSEDALRHAFKMGGLAMPSVAGVRLDRSKFGGFGEITLIGGKDLVDPQKNPAMKWFDADIYSPRYPHTMATYEGENASKVANAFEKYAQEIRPITQKNPYGPKEWTPQSIVDSINRRGFDEASWNHLGEYAYLREHGLLEAPSTKLEEHELRMQLIGKLTGQREKVAEWIQQKVDEAGAKPKDVIKVEGKPDIEHTLDNVMAVMKAEKLRGGEGEGFGAGGMRARVAKGYGALEEMGADRERVIPREEMTNVTKKAAREFARLREDLESIREDQEMDPETTERDVIDFIEGDEKHLRNVYGDNYENMAAMTQEFLDKIRKLPTEYFEGKVSDIVPLEGKKFAAAVVPDSIDPALRSMLEKQGIKTVSYTRGDAEMRRAAIERMTRQQEVNFMPGGGEGEPISNREDAHRRWSEGEEIYAFHEQDETSHKITSLQELDSYAPDQLMALPAKKGALAQAVDTGATVPAETIRPNEQATKTSQETQPRGDQGQDVGQRAGTGYRTHAGGAETGDRFHRAITEAVAGHPLGAAVEIKDVSEYQKEGYKLILADDDTAGVAVTPDGDLVSVFKKPGSKAKILDHLKEAVEQGAETLDAYDINGFLPNLYQNIGFRPTGRIKFNREYAPEGWPYDKAGEPDIVFMTRDPNRPVDPNYDYNAEREQVPLHESYDDAVAARDAIRATAPEAQLMPGGGEAKISEPSPVDDPLRVGTAKLGTSAKPAPTPQDSNIHGGIVPPELLARQMEAFNYPHLSQEIRGEKDPQVKRQKTIDWMVKNLLALHDAFPAEVRAAATRWYDGANKIAKDFGGRFGYTPEQAAGVLAALSPQKDWFMNVAQAEQLMNVWKNHQDTKITPELVGAELEDMISGAVAKPGELRKAKPGETKVGALRRRSHNEQLHEKARDKRRALLEQMLGKSVAELDADPHLQAWAIRALAQSLHGRDYRVVSPDGDPMHLAAKDDGTPQRNGWGSMEEIKKGVRMLKNGDLTSISDNLSNEHKVRNFYNNIIAPNTPFGDATMDTHAVAAAHILPLGSSALEVTHNFGSKGMPGSEGLGISGSYHLYLDAYKKAAEERGLLPRQMQSITWEAIRGLYSPKMRRDKAAVAKARGTWQALPDAKARQQLIGRGIATPAWARASHGGEPKGVAKGDGRARRGDDVGGNLRYGDRPNPGSGQGRGRLAPSAKGKEPALRGLKLSEGKGKPKKGALAR